jgi:ATP-dependent RNA helicase SUPV3L1/SUV3
MKMAGNVVMTLLGQKSIRVPAKAIVGDDRLFRRIMFEFCAPKMIQKLPKRLLNEIINSNADPNVKSRRKYSEAITSEIYPIFMNFVADFMHRRGSDPFDDENDLFFDDSFFYGSDSQRELLEFDQEMRKTAPLLADLRLPHEQFPLARSLKRKIFLHTGPTNSGKTHSALTSLAAAESGVYCGPLRLLAWEIYERLNAQGVPCNLLTGQEQIVVSGAKHVSCTVEMASTTQMYDVGVVDEIQMMADPDRGSSWTRALLGIAAKEVHVCGDLSTRDIVQELAGICDDEFQSQTYTRLSKLLVTNPISGIHRLERYAGGPVELMSCRGDCVIAFSRKHIYTLKDQIERSLGMKACVIYGRLPPETRKQQAQLFNEPGSQYDILVASDAIGMGLNLNIRRIVFSSLSKFDGTKTRPLNNREVSQIAGRAGRFKSIYPEGYVSYIKQRPVVDIQDALSTPLEMIDQAGLVPSLDVISKFHANPSFSDYSFSDLIAIASKFASVDGTYFVCNTDTIVQIANIIEEFDLSLEDKYTLCNAPVSPDNRIQVKFFKEYVSRLALKVPVKTGVKSFSKEVMNAKAVDYLETMHSVLELYVWLSYRFAPFFPARDSAKIKSLEISMLVHNSLLKMGDKNIKMSLFEDDVDFYDDFDDF